MVKPTTLLAVASNPKLEKMGKEIDEKLIEVMENSK